MCISYLKSPDVAIAGLLRSQNKQNNPETSNLWPARSKIGRILPFLPFTHHEPARARCCHDSTPPFHYFSLLWISLTLMVLICFNQGWPPRGEGGVPRPAPPRKNDQNRGEVAGQNIGQNLNFLQKIVNYKNLSKNMSLYQTFLQKSRQLQ